MPGGTFSNQVGTIFFMFWAKSAPFYLEQYSECTESGQKSPLHVPPGLSLNFWSHFLPVFRRILAGNSICFVFLAPEGFCTSWNNRVISIRRKNNILYLAVFVLFWRFLCQNILTNKSPCRGYTSFVCAVLRLAADAEPVLNWIKKKKEITFYCFSRFSQLEKKVRHIF